MAVPSKSTETELLVGFPEIVKPKARRSLFLSSVNAFRAMELSLFVTMVILVSRQLESSAGEKLNRMLWYLVYEHRAETHKTKKVHLLA